jgi:hypothetical protein
MFAWLSVLMVHAAPRSGLRVPAAAGLLERMVTAAISGVID